MKIMILTAATGGGHIRAAEAVGSYINGNTDYEAKVLDTFKVMNPVLDKTVCDGYLFLAKKTPQFFGKLYAKSNKDTKLSDLVVNFSTMCSKLLYPVIESYKPDIILSTHPFSTEMVSCLKDSGKVKAPLICLMTDYGVHKAWISDNVDAYVVATSDMIADLKTFGVPENKIYPFGIPVMNVFFEKEDREMALREEGLSDNIPVILFMAGSFGVANIIQLYRSMVSLNIPLQIIIITGKNKKLYEAMEKEVATSKVKTRLIYFTEEVDKYMHISDILVTKPGGLTVSEALACNLPMAVFDAIPGQEEDNANFLKTHDMGVRISKDEDFGLLMENLLSEKNKLNKMRESCSEFDTSDSIPNIIKLMESLVKNNSVS
jgi:processive 1,2-diacylglycerol beta-glucosyltransferase